MLGSGGAASSPGPYVADFENNYTFAPKVKDLPQVSDSFQSVPHVIVLSVCFRRRWRHLSRLRSSYVVLGW